MKVRIFTICYGKGVKAIGEDLNISEKHAQEVYDAVLTAFPGLQQFMVDSQQMAEDLGYVTTNWGRKRRLPDRHRRGAGMVRREEQGRGRFRRSDGRYQPRQIRMAEHLLQQEGRA